MLVGPSLWLWNLHEPSFAALLLRLQNCDKQWESRRLPEVAAVGNNNVTKWIIKHAESEIPRNLRAGWTSGQTAWLSPWHQHDYIVLHLSTAVLPTCWIKNNTLHANNESWKYKPRGTRNILCKLKASLTFTLLDSHQTVLLATLCILCSPELKVYQMVLNNCLKVQLSFIFSLLADILVIRLRSDCAARFLIYQKEQLSWVVFGNFDINVKRCCTMFDIRRRFLLGLSSCLPGGFKDHCYRLLVTR